jgi:hypothetical protein
MLALATEMHPVARKAVTGNPEKSEIFSFI